jgi:hypothetical protein
MVLRNVQIVDASVESEEGGSDAAYDLIGVEGTPEQVGTVITKELGVADLSKGNESLLAAGKPVFLNLRIQLTPRPASVWDYFKEHLGQGPDDDLLNLPLDTNCGSDCREAIDAAKAFMQHLKNADGESLASREIVCEQTERICMVYFRG